MKRSLQRSMIVFLILSVPFLSASDTEAYEFEQESVPEVLLSSVISVMNAPQQISQMSDLSAGQVFSFADHQMNSDTLFSVGLGSRFGASLSIHAASGYEKGDWQLAISPEASVSCGLGFGDRSDGEGYHLLYGISLYALSAASLQDPDSPLVIRDGEVSDEALKLSSGIGLNTGALIDWDNGFSLAAELSDILNTKMHFTTRVLSQVSAGDLFSIMSSDHHEQKSISGALDLGYRFDLSPVLQSSLSVGLQTGDSTWLIDHLRADARIVYADELMLSFRYTCDDLSCAVSYRLGSCDLLLAYASSGTIYAGIGLPQSQ